MSKVIQPGSTIGVLGSGQLGRMPALFAAAEDEAWSRNQERKAAAEPNSGRQ